jgi:hypothetical protein
MTLRPPTAESFAQSEAELAPVELEGSYIGGGQLDAVAADGMAQTMAGGSRPVLRSSTAEDGGDEALIYSALCIEIPGDRGAIQLSRETVVRLKSSRNLPIHPHWLP